MCVCYKCSIWNEFCRTRDKMFVYGYGMPELDWKYGYVGYFWGVTVLITVFMMLLLLTKDVVMQ